MLLLNIKAFFLTNYYCELLFIDELVAAFAFARGLCVPVVGLFLSVLLMRFTLRDCGLFLDVS